MSEFTEMREAHERITALARETAAVLTESIRVQQRLRNVIARVLGEPAGLRSVHPEPEMAVWNAAEAEKR